MTEKDHGWESKNKNTKLKAIHNQLLLTNSFKQLGIKEQKYKIESYSQLGMNITQNAYGWESKNKNTKLKAIHNLRGVIGGIFFCWESKNKNTKLKAIHKQNICDKWQ